MDKRANVKRTRVLTLEQMMGVAWLVPMRRLKAVFDMSDRGLTIQLQAAGIPTPPRGYHRKMEVGFTTYNYPRLDPDLLATPLSLDVHDSDALDRVLDSGEFKDLVAKFDASTPHWLRAIGRRELHAVVWSVPIKQLSAILHISDEEILAACKNHDIPVPKSRDWARLAQGHPFTKIAIHSADTDVLMIPRDIDVQALIDPSVTTPPVKPAKAVDLSADAFALVAEWHEAGTQKIGRGTPDNLIEGLAALGIANAKRQEILQVLDNLPPNTSLVRRVDGKVAAGTASRVASALRSLAAYQGVSRRTGEKKPPDIVPRELKGDPTDPARNAETVRTFLVWMRARKNHSSWYEKRDLAAFELMFRHGLGISEVLSVDADGCRLFNRALVVYPGTSRERVVPIGDEAILALSRYGEVRPSGATSALFLSHNRLDRLSADGLGTRFSRYLERAGFRQIVQLRSIASASDDASC